MNKNNKKIKVLSLLLFTSYLSLFTFSGCQNSNLTKNISPINNNTVVSNSKFLPNNKKTELHGTISFPKTRKEEIEAFKIKSKSKFNTKANVSDIAPNATISFILPESNNVIATGLSDSTGAFTISLNAVNGDFFNPEPNRVYILEASKRIGSSGNNTMAIRTFVRWNGTFWDSITDNELRINEYTTAYTIIQGYNISTITPESTIAKIQVNGNVLTPLVIGSISIPTINSVIGMVSSILAQSKDPVAFVKIKPDNVTFFADINASNIQSLAQQNSCSNCDLTQIDLSNVSLAGKDLSYANLQGKDLSNQNLSETILVGANLKEAILPNNLSYLNMSGADLTGQNLSEKNLDGSVLTGANLTGVTISGSAGNLKDLTNTRFNECNFKDSILTYLKLDDLNLYETIFENTDISNNSMKNVDLEGVDLSKIKIKNLTTSNTDLTGANLATANISTLDVTGKINGSELQGAIAEASVLSSTTNPLNLTSKNLTGANFRGADLRGVNFRGANLTNVDFSYFTNVDGSFKPTNLSGVKLSNLTLTNLDFQKANMTSAQIAGADFTGSNLRDVIFTSAFVSQSVFRSTDLRGATLRGSMSFCDFSYANMSALDLSAKSFSFCKFGTTNFYLTNFVTGGSSASFQNCDMTNQILVNLSDIDQNIYYKPDTFLLAQGPAQAARNFTGVNFTNTKLTSAIMQGSIFNLATFTGSTVDLAAIAAASFGAARWIDGVTVCQPGSVGGCIPI